MHAAPVPELKMCDLTRPTTARTFENTSCRKPIARPIIVSKQCTVQREKVANSRLADWQLLPFNFPEMQLRGYINPQISTQAHTHLWRLIPNFYATIFCLLPLKDAVEAEGLCEAAAVESAAGSHLGYLRSCPLSRSQLSFCCELVPYEHCL